MIKRLLIFLIAVAVIAAVGLLGYSYLGDVSPDTETMRVPVDVNVD